MIAEISIIPVGAKTTSLRTCVDAAVEAIGATGIACRVDEMGTNVEGSLEEITHAFQAAHDACARQGVGRLMATLRVDDRLDQPEHLEPPPRRPGGEPSLSPQEATGQYVDHFQQLPRDAQLGIVRTVVPQLLRDMPLEERAGYLRDLITEVEVTLGGAAPYDVRPSAPSHQPG
ncbi:MAG: MTH1187 family thiamine-binding protein [Deltaproteobacteria bacterium]|nr:MTH1187 family thiamine-binding protein [Deltaproteobacteria bacterium]